MASKTEKKESSFKQQDLSSFQIILIHLLREDGPMTRDQICEELGFKKHKVIHLDKYLLRGRGIHYREVIERYDKRTTIYDNLVKLQKKKIVDKFSRNNGKRGRPQVFWKITEGK